MSTSARSPSGKAVIRRRLTLFLCAAIVLASWGIAARTYATSGGGGYNDGLFASLIVAAMTLTIGAAILVAWAWRDRLKPLLAALVSVLAALSILCLALAINLRG